MILLTFLIFVGLITEILFVQLILQHSLQLALILHIISSVSISLSVLIFLRKYYKHEVFIAFISTFLLCFFIPVSGLVIILFVIFSIFSTHKKFHKHVETLDDSINLEEINPIHARYGAGGTVLHLLNKTKPPSDRIKALFVLAEDNLTQVNNLMYQLLPDNSNEIRLLAFHILEQQENSLSVDINKLQDALKNTNLNRETIAKIEKNIAMLYWEFVYKKLVLNELELLILKKAEQYALSAVNVLKCDATSWALLGKIYSRMKQYDLAADAFSRTRDFNIPPSQVLPYLAEIQFHVRHFVAVRQYLNESDTLSDSTLIAPVRRFWSNR